MPVMMIIKFSVLAFFFLFVFFSVWVKKYERRKKLRVEKKTAERKTLLSFGALIF